MTSKQNPYSIVVSPPQTPARLPPWLERGNAIMAERPAQNAAPEISALQAIADSLISGGTGAVLGVLNAELKDGLDVNGKPLDLFLCGFTGAAGMLLKSRALLSTSHACMSVFSYRKMDQLRSVLKEFAPNKAATPPIDVSGEVLNDLEQELGTSKSS